MKQSKFFQSKQSDKDSIDLIGEENAPAIENSADRVIHRSFVDDTTNRSRLHSVAFSSDDDDDENVVDHVNYHVFSSTSISYTSLEKQILNLRQQYPDSLLMVECGYRMRFFGEDAIAAAQVLNIFAHQDHNFMVASVPTYRAFLHCQRLLTAGHKVAIVRQTETATTRKNCKRSCSSTFNRSVVGIFTEGTLISSDDPAFDGLQLLSLSNDNQQHEVDLSDLEEADEIEFLATDSYDNAISNDELLIASVYEIKQTSAINCDQIAIAIINIRAHQIIIKIVDMDRLRQAFQDNIDFFKPREVVTSDNCSSLTTTCLEERLYTPCSTSVIHYIKRLKLLPSTQFENGLSKVISMGGSWIANQPVGVQRSVNGLFYYLSEFGLQSSLTSPELVGNEAVSDMGNGLNNGSTKSQTTSFTMDGITMRDLEVFDSLGNSFGRLKTVGQLSHIGTNSKRIFGGLFGLINNCRSTYGRRTLKHWLMHPLTDREEILRRQDAIEWIMPKVSEATLSKLSDQYRKEVVEIVSQYPDVETILTSLQFNRISPMRMYKLLRFTTLLSSWSATALSNNDFEQLPVLFQLWIQKINGQHLSKAARSYLGQLAYAHTGDDVSTSSGISGIFTVKAEERITHLATLAQEEKKIIEKLDEELRIIRTDLRRPHMVYSSLRTGPTSQIEHLIELPLKEEKNISTADGHWIKVSCTKQVVRFHNRHILAIQDELYRIRDEIKVASRSAWREFCEDVKANMYTNLRLGIQMLGNFDAIISLSIVAHQYPNYCKPSYPKCSNEMIVRNGRHPMLERILEDCGYTFTPNDVHLSQQFQTRSCQVVTGPNMGGKSSFVRMIALIALLGQIGSYVPSEYASLCIFDTIFTRMGAEDDISLGKSTFMSELIRTNKILTGCTARSLIIIDELGTGTATNDGQAIAEATLHYILHNIGCATLFITHFRRIAHLVDGDVYGNRAFNSHMSYLETVNKEGDCEVIFLYKSEDRPSDASHGINVARLAKLPSRILDRAREMSAWLEKQDNLTIK